MNRDLPIFLAVVVVLLATMLELPLSSSAAKADNRVAGVASSVEVGNGQATLKQVARPGGPGGGYASHAGKTMAATSVVTLERAD